MAAAGENKIFKSSWRNFRQKDQSWNWACSISHYRTWLGSCGKISDYFVSLDQSGSLQFDALKQSSVAATRKWSLVVFIKLLAQKFSRASCHSVKSILAPQHADSFVIGFSGASRLFYVTRTQLKVLLKPLGTLLLWFKEVSEELLNTAERLYPLSRLYGWWLRKNSPPE